MINMIDTHIHFDDDRFDSDRDEIYNTAIKAGVDTMIIPATTKARWQKIFDLCTRYKNVHPTAGLHPVFIDQHSDSHLDDLKETLTHNNCVAVGECGLDGFHKNLDYRKQQQFFEQQIQVARDTGLPLIVHARSAVQDVIQLLKPSQTTGVVHSYNGSYEQAKQLIDLGYLLSFGGATSYDRATRLKKLVKALPLDALMIETDAPDQPPSQHNSSRNTPAYLVEVVASIATIKDISADSVIAMSNTNARQLFQI